MNNGLPTIIEQRSQYEVEYDANAKKMEELFNAIFPNIQVPAQYIFEILSFLQETNVNAGVLPKVIRGVNNILLGTGKGQVIVHIQKEIMNVSVRENDDEIKSKGDY